ncbi:MAG TPA: hypothetical protein VFA44_04775 [Gaiellaceae bacterium]|nr:hypothetical protein [Gaiellaceae bacterium]
MMGESLSSRPGSRRLLRDCTSFGRLVAAPRRSARERLEAELGAELTALLLASLTSGAGMREARSERRGRAA